MSKPNSLLLSRRGMISGLVALSGAAVLASRRVAASPAPFQTVGAIGFTGSELILASDRFWRSTDGGATWIAASDLDAGSVTALATHKDRPGRVFASLQTGGLIRSEDGGASWRDAGKGLPTAAATAVIIAAQLPETLYVAVKGDGVWRSKDNGSSWEFVMDRPYLAKAERDVLTLASVNIATGMGGDWIYAGTERGLIRVPDCFCRWQGVDDPDAMAALAEGKQAAPAQPLPDGQALLSLALAPSAPSTLYAGLQAGVWKSADAGLRWAQISGHPAPHLAVNPTDPNHVIAATDGAILSSRDGGITWSAPAAA